jgi:hypothetical protein
MAMEPPLAPVTSIAASARSGAFWTPVLAGAFTATAVSFILLGFGAAIGLSTASTAPTWRDASFALWLLSGIYLILVSVAASGVGGYIAGRSPAALREPLGPDEFHFHDGVRGLTAWGVAIILSACLAIAGVNALRNPVPQAAGATASAAEPLLSYELDRLFRSERLRDPAATQDARAAAGRILLTTGSHAGVSTEDRAYLIRLVAARSEISAADAETRVNVALGAALTAISKARRTAVLMAFLTAAALLLGAAVAWLTACEGGQDQRGRSGSRMAMLFRARVVPPPR